MSHFIGLVFGENYEDILDYYSENREIDRYLKYSREEAINKAKKHHQENYEYAVEKFTDIEKANNWYKSLLLKGPEISDKEAWEEVEKWGYDMDDAGNLYSTYNTASKWDWYQIGGRWNGFIVLKEKNEFNEGIEVNEAYFDEIDWDYMLENNVPFCFITPAGDWIQKGEMGWFGIASNEKSDCSWEQQFREFLKTIDCNCLVTAIDFHI